LSDYHCFLLVFTSPSEVDMIKPKFLSLFILTSCCFASAAHAQGLVGSWPLAPQKQLLTGHCKNRDNPEFKAQRLRKALDLPDVPAYSGDHVRFVTGTMFANVKGGPSSTMQFSVNEDPSVVLQWYRNVLIQNKWSVLDNTAGKKSLAAMKANNICQITTVGASKANAKCDLLVRYKFYKATDLGAN